MPARAPKPDSKDLARISKALADPSRLEMLQRIAASKDPPTCSRMCRWLGLSPATISHHLHELAGAGLINVERDGKFARVTVRRDVLAGYVNRLLSL